MFTLSELRSGTSTDVCVRSGLDWSLWIDNSDIESVLSIGCSTTSDEGDGDDIGASIVLFFGLESGVFKKVRSSSSLNTVGPANEARFGTERI